MSDLQATPGRDATPSPSDIHSVERAWSRVDAGKAEARTVQCRVEIRFDLPVADNFDPDATLDRIQSGIAALFEGIGRRVVVGTGRDPLV